MSFEQRLNEDLKNAMRSGDKLRLETIRSLKTMLKNAQIEKMRELTDDEVLQLLNSAAKRRKESIEQFRNSGREDRAAEEEKELAIIQAYLPAQLDESEIEKIVVETIAEVNATSPKDMGKVMGAIMPKVKGRADGKLIQQIVKSKLGG
jgi:hypothetical protein